METPLLHQSNASTFKKLIQSNVFYFLIYSITLALVSYGSMNVGFKCWILLLGLILPFLIQINFSSPGMSKTLFPSDFLFPTGSFLWLFPALASIFLRFYKLSTLVPWPLQDEAVHGYLAQSLLGKAEPQFFYTSSQFPPFYIWGMGFFFKFFEPSLMSLWLFPAILSTLALVFSFVAARLFFSKSFSFIFFLLSALSFWPLVIGRFSHAGILVLFWENLTLMLAGFLWNSRDSIRRLTFLILSGFMTGLGFYTFTSWTVVAISLTLLVLIVQGGSQDRKPRFFLPFLLPALLICIPYFILVFLNHSWGKYVLSILNFPHSAGSFKSQFLTSFSYLSGLGWGPAVGSFYSPNWGGFLNPILGACFFLGLSWASKNRKSKFVQWGIFSFLLFLLPGLLTGNVEYFRIIQILPFLMLVVAIGWASLFGPMTAGKMRTGIFAAMLSLSLCLDLYHLFIVCPKAWAPQGGQSYPEQGIRFYQYGSAFKLLESTASQKGPGFILTNLVFPPDPSLVIASYPFNASLNPRLSENPAIGAL